MTLIILPRIESLHQTRCDSVSVFMVSTTAIRSAASGSSANIRFQVERMIAASDGVVSPSSTAATRYGAGPCATSSSVQATT